MIYILYHYTHYQFFIIISIWDKSIEDTNTAKRQQIKRLLFAKYLPRIGEQLSQSSV